MKTTPPRYRSMKFRYPAPEDDKKPHISVASPAPTASIPTNLGIIAQVSRLKREFPERVAPNIDKSREFFLTEIAPLVLGISNGLQDAKEILERAFEEPADTQHLFASIEDSMQKAILAKIISFVQDYSSLKDSEKAMHTLLHMLKENTGNVDTQSLLLKMLSISNLPRSKQRPEVQVRELQTTKRNRKHN